MIDSALRRTARGVEDARVQWWPAISPNSDTCRLTLPLPRSVACVRDLWIQSSRSRQCISMSSHWRRSRSCRCPPNCSDQCAFFSESLCPRTVLIMFSSALICLFTRSLKNLVFIQNAVAGVWWETRGMGTEVPQWGPGGMYGVWEQSPQKLYCNIMHL